MVLVTKTTQRRGCRSRAACCVCCETLGMLFFRSILPEKWISMGVFLDETNRSRIKANSKRRPDFGFSKNCGTFLPKSCGYFPAISTIPGNEQDYGMIITKFVAKWVQKTYLMLHQSYASTCAVVAAVTLAQHASGGEKYTILPFPEEFSYRCFTGRQKCF